MKPMLAKTGTEDLLARKDYYFEPKLDGARALCYKKTKLKFTSRNGINITKKYPEFDFFDQIECDECILDGEIVVYDEQGNPSFALWAKRDKGKINTAATYVVFDILYKDGESLLNLPLYARKKILDKIIKPHDHLQTSVYTKQGKKLWKIIQGKKLEGVVAKKDDSSYEMDTRSESWLKIKLTQTADCVVIGYTKEKRAVTSLALGLYNQQTIQYVGKVGIGLSEETIAHFKEQLDNLEVDQSSIETERGVIPVKPEIVVQVRFLHATPDRKLRAPVFERIRDDKKPKECTIIQLN